MIYPKAEALDIIRRHYPCIAKPRVRWRTTLGVKPATAEYEVHLAWRYPRSRGVQSCGVQIGRINIDNWSVDWEWNAYES